GQSLCHLPAHGARDRRSRNRPAFGLLPGFGSPAHSRTQSPADVALTGPPLHLRRWAGTLDAMKRRDFVKAAFWGSAGVGTEFAWATPASPATRISRGQSAFELDEITLKDLQAGLDSARFTAVGLVKKYVARIEEIDRKGPRINSAIELNPDALQ